MCGAETLDPGMHPARVTDQEWLCFSGHIPHITSATQPLVVHLLVGLLDALCCGYATVLASLVVLMKREKKNLNPVEPTLLALERVKDC